MHKKIYKQYSLQLISTNRHIAILLNINYKEANDVILKFAKLQEKGFTSEGKVHALRRCKFLFSAASGQLARQQIRHDVGCNFKSDKHIAPKCIKFLGKFLASKDPNKIRFCLSLLKSYILLETDLELNTHSLTARYKGQPIEEDKIKSFMKDLDLYYKFPKFNKNCSSFGGVCSEKSGPNGSPSWKKGHYDKLALMQPSAKRLKDSIVKFFEMTNRKARGKLVHKIRPGNYFKHKVLTFFAHTPDYYYHSRLELLPKVGGGTRIIAIADIFSQSALMPIHQFLFRLLREKFSECDGTFDQQKQTTRIQEGTKQGRYLFSYDIKSCTDRFPVLFQRHVLAHFISDELADVWKDIMTEREFTYYIVRNQQKVDIDTVRYSVGQPMGLLSSGAIMSFSHHIIVKICAKQAGLYYDFRDYAILGDDIVISNKLVAQHYTAFLNDLGMDISIPKSVIGVGVAEFAKNFLVDGVNLSPLSPKLLLAFTQFPKMLPGIRRELSTRWDIDVGVIQTSMLCPKSNRNNILRILTSPIWEGDLYGGYPKHQIISLMEKYRFKKNPNPHKLVEKVIKSNLKGRKKMKNSYDILVPKHISTPCDQVMSDVVHPNFLGFNSGPINFDVGGDFITGDNHSNTGVIASPLDSLSKNPYIESNFKHTEGARSIDWDSKSLDYCLNYLQINETQNYYTIGTNPETGRKRKSHQLFNFSFSKRAKLFQNK